MSGSMLLSILGMYDLPELKNSTDAWYKAVTSLYQNSTNAMEPTETSPPDNLCRDATVGLSDIAAKNQLFIGQTCGLPLLFCLDSFAIVGIPQYSAPGCDRHFYRSVVIVHTDSALQDLEDLQIAAESKMNGSSADDDDLNLILAMNSRSSCSGCLLFVATVGADIMTHVITDCIYTGAHDRSVEYACMSV